MPRVYKNVTVRILKSDKPKYKYIAIFRDPSGLTKTVYFGATGYSDFTIHKNPERMRRYLSRHKKRESWTGQGLFTAGALSRWILWSKPNIDDAIRDYKRKVSRIKSIKKYPENRYPKNRNLNKNQ